MYNSTIDRPNMKNNIKKAAKKELEANIADKFMHVLAELGHDATKLKREVKKASKFIVKKIERKLNDVKHVVEAKLDTAPVKAAVKRAEGTSATAKKAVAKKAVAVEKVIAKAAKVAEKKVAKTVVKPATAVTKAVTTEVKAVAKKPVVAKAKVVAKPATPAKAATTKAKTVKK